MDRNPVLNRVPSSTYCYYDLRDLSTLIARRPTDDKSSYNISQHFFSHFSHDLTQIREFSATSEIP